MITEFVFWGDLFNLIPVEYFVYYLIGTDMQMRYHCEMVYLSFCRLLVTVFLTLVSIFQISYFFIKIDLFWTCCQYIWIGCHNEPDIMFFICFWQIVCFDKQ